MFTSQPPSGKAVTLLTDTVFIGEDAAGGGTDLDAQRTYNFAGRLAPLKQHPKQGYHVKLYRARDAVCARTGRRGSTA